jgi:phage baseplate assembly protein W
MSQPVNPTDFGTTLSCQFDIDPMGQTVSGLTALAQALIRRITTPRGRLLNDPNYGYDIAGELEDDVTTQQVAAIGANVDQEFLKDQRVFSSVTTVTLETDGQLDVSTQVQSALGPFSLVFTLSATGILTIVSGP